MEWKTDVLTPDDGRTIAYGQYRDDVRWNGWLCPRFTRDVAISVVASIVTHETDPVMTYTVRDDGAIVITEWDGDESYPEVLTADSDGMYAVGAYAWTWRVHDPTADR